MRKLFSVDDFARRLKEGMALPDGAALYRLASTAEADLTDVDNRVIRYVFSTGAVARDLHTINQSGWDFTGYDLNPVFLWAHDMDAPPIGRVIEKSVRGGALMGAVQYAEADLSPFADMVFRMVKERYLNAVSTSWLPIEWKWSAEKSRVGGIDFLKQDMLEISQVSVPAQITAIATARAAGINTGPMVDWAERLLDGDGKVLIPRAELEQLRAAAQIPKTPKREAVMKTNLLNCTTRMSRDLYDVSNLAYLLMSLCYLEDNVSFEAEIEGDGSDVPGRLLDLIKGLGQVLVDMTAEEVAELFEAEAMAGANLTAITESFKSPAQRAVVMLGVMSRKARAFMTGPLTADGIGAAVRKAIEDSRTETSLTAQVKAALDAMTQAGRVLSKSNEDDLRSALGLIQNVVKQVEDDTDEEESADDVKEREALELRQRESHFIEASAA